MTPEAGPPDDDDLLVETFSSSPCRPAEDADRGSVAL
jgi:hypothetical protein